MYIKLIEDVFSGWSPYHAQPLDAFLANNYKEKLTVTENLTRFLITATKIGDQLCGLKAFRNYVHFPYGEQFDHTGIKKHDRMLPVDEPTLGQFRFVLLTQCCQLFL